MRKFICVFVLWVLTIIMTSLICSQCLFVESSNKCDTVYVENTIIMPSVKDSIVTKTITRYLPISKINTDTTYVYLTGTLRDSIMVDVPISRKVYDGDEYHAVISGFEASLDTISIKSKTITNTIYQTLPKWGIGVSAGYGLSQNGLSPYVGIGLTYNLWTWKKKRN